MSWPISRVLSGTIIRLGHTSLYASSNLPAPNAGRTIGGLFGLAPGGVYLATNCYQMRGALLPHPFSLTCSPKGHRRSSLCCTCRRLAPPRRYLAPCPVEPGLSSPPSVYPKVQRRSSDCLANSRRPILLTKKDCAIFIIRFPSPIGIKRSFSGHKSLPLVPPLSSVATPLPGFSGWTKPPALCLDHLTHNP